MRNVHATDYIGAGISEASFADSSRLPKALLCGAITTVRAMGYTGLYSLGARCGSEAIATGLMIFLGEGTLANELLNKTKGHNMGFGWVRLMPLAV